MKAISVLKHITTFCGVGLHNDCVEAIAELEALQSRSCEGCKCWDSVEFSIIKTLSYCRFLNTGTKNTFYCSEFEAKKEMKCGL